MRNRSNVICVKVPVYASPVYSGMTAFKQYGAEATDSEVVRETELLFVKSTFNIAEEKRIWKQIRKTSP